MTVRDALRKGTGSLKAAGIETPVNEAGVMLCHVIKCDKSFLYSHGEQEMSGGELRQYMEYIAQRALGKPLQYITGHQEFMSLDFAVTPAVLIPRADTEILVEAVIDYFSPQGATPDGVCRLKENPRVLDIGTGSGCIAISLAYYIGGCSVTAVDISREALDIALFNAKRLGVADRIEFRRSNVFDMLTETENATYDAIVSNPPYIPDGDMENLQAEVRGFEPEIALKGGADGLDFYRHITGCAAHFLKPGGLLAFEVGYNQAGPVLQLMKEKYAEVRVIKDLSGIDRVVAGNVQTGEKKS